MSSISKKSVSFTKKQVVAPRSVEDALLSLDNNTIETAKKYFTQLLQENRLHFNPTAQGIISVIVDVVEYSAKNFKNKLTSQEKLNLAFSIAEFCVNSLLDQKLISQKIHDDVLTYLNAADTFTDIVGDIVSFLYNHKDIVKEVVCCGCFSKKK